MNTIVNSNNNSFWIIYIWTGWSTRTVCLSWNYNFAVTNVYLIGYEWDCRTVCLLWSCVSVGSNFIWLWKSIKSIIWNITKSYLVNFSWHFFWESEFSILMFHLLISSPLVNISKQLEMFWRPSNVKRNKVIVFWCWGQQWRTSKVSYHKIALQTWFSKRIFSTARYSTKF